MKMVTILRLPTATIKAQAAIPAHQAYQDRPDRQDLPDQAAKKDLSTAQMMNIFNYFD